MEDLVLQAAGVLAILVAIAHGTILPSCEYSPTPTSSREGREDCRV
jgi:uncharacterized membrane protein YraQ (UPF0718 family)